MPVADWFTQRLGDPHHQQQIDAREPRHPRIERAEHIGIGVDPPRERRPREIDVTGRQNEVIEKEAHLSETRPRSEEHPSEIQSLMRIAYAAFCLKKETTQY